MIFRFKGMSDAEEKYLPNFMNEAEHHTVEKDFEDMKAAIQYVHDNLGFVTTDDGKSSFLVRSIKEK
jgi:hypothetical protein